MKYVVLFLSVGLITFSCAEEKKTEETVKEEIPVQQEITDTTTFKNDITSFNPLPGVVGVVDVPEMLVLSILDSADTKKVSSVMIDNYALLEEEMNAIGAEMNGAIGMLTYNNDVRNFKFENILCIRAFPKVQPKRCNLVVLEASKMLVYNFYGSYQNLFAAYDKIKRYCDKNDLVQTGPMREFYITDPEKEKNPEKWLTRIMLPVVSMHKK
jgi:effector-binding domain-containing protein